jgi:Transcriptional regulator LmrA/YxaF-like, C-terminal domain
VRLRQAIAPSSATPAAKEPSVAVAVQPQSLPSTIPSVISASASASSAAPGRSGRRWSRSGRSARWRLPAQTIAAPSGRLTRKTSRQSFSSTSAPPRVGPVAGDAEQEDPLVAEAIGEAARRDQQRRDHDEVAVEHPGERVAPRAGEGGRDVGEGDVDDRRVEEGAGEKEAAAFAGLVVSTIEGALIRARAAGDESPLRSATTGLHRALDALLAR